MCQDDGYMWHSLADEHFIMHTDELQKQHHVEGKRYKYCTRWSQFSHSISKACSKFNFKFQLLYFFPFSSLFLFFGFAYCCSVVVSIWWFSRKCTYVIVWISQNARLSDKNDDELNRAAESCVSVYVGSAVYELASRWWLTTDPGGTAILERLYPSNRNLTHTCLICKYFFKVLTDMISVVWIF